jgi:2-keto-4-pentenoate hydratase/2-oxohepta-3-ene-1,7-dioic acid hydratase in catechol pathway
MKLIRFRQADWVDCGVLTPRGIVPFEEVRARRGANLPYDLLPLIQGGNLEPLQDLADLAAVPPDEVEPILPYDVPPKIWCIGLNYKRHADELGAAQPEEPGSFMKPASCLFPPGGEIILPPPGVAAEVDCEGELGVIIGKRCRFVPAEHVSDVIFGYTTTMDLTALDVLARNTRYLTRAKSIDTFFSFGPVIVTADELKAVENLEVVTERNGEILSSDVVANMKHSPANLVRFHSEYFTWEPGDVLSTGCPRAGRIFAGDRVRSRIDGVGALDATVVQGDREPLW